MEEINISKEIKLDYKHKQPAPIKRAGNAPGESFRATYSWWDKFKYMWWYRPCFKFIQKVTSKHITHMAWLLGSGSLKNSVGFPVTPKREKSPVEQVASAFTGNYAQHEIYDEKGNKIPDDLANAYEWDVEEEAWEVDDKGNRV